MNNAGNLIDACYLSSLMGLLTFRKPFIKIESENNIKIFSSKEKNPQPLSITHIPISFTYGFFNEANQVISDPTVIFFILKKITIIASIYQISIKKKYYSGFRRRNNGGKNNNCNEYI